MPADLELGAAVKVDRTYAPGHHAQHKLQDTICIPCSPATARGCRLRPALGGTKATAAVSQVRRATTEKLPKRGMGGRANLSNGKVTISSSSLQVKQQRYDLHSLFASHGTGL